MIELVSSFYLDSRGFESHLSSFPFTNCGRGLSSASSSADDSYFAGFVCLRSVSGALRSAHALAQNVFERTSPFDSLQNEKSPKIGSLRLS